ncbi:MAG TPA: glycosyltransferase [Streptosporangiaceae bacterium]|nr:glycosyltransferase [Streptosporangiaceae bacterium]
MTTAAETASPGEQAGLRRSASWGAFDNATRAAAASTVLAPAPVPLLFLIADTGGGHRSAALAVSQALELAYPGRFAPVLCDPLGGPDAFAPLRWITGLYGPSIRLTPWIWGAIYYGFQTRPAMRWLRRTVSPIVARPVAAAVAAHQPAAIVSFHPLTGGAAVSALGDGAAVGAADDGADRPPVVTVVTDLATTHRTWHCAEVDRIVVPLAAASGDRDRSAAAPGRYVEIGLPVTPEFLRGPLRARERRALRQSLGLSRRRFLVVLTGGAEGSGRIYRRTAAIVRRFDDVAVVVICGRNRRLQRRLTRLAARAGGRLAVKGFVDNMAEWLRCADVVVTKAGPGTIAEATCCGAPLVLTSHVPGQEEGNAEFVVAAGAGRHAPRVRQLVSEIAWLRRDPAAIAAMRAASARLSRPEAAADIAALVAGLTVGPMR